MGIEARHAYRFGYLQSEHWKNLRVKKLASEDAKCIYCGHRDLSNDVHHVHYPKDLFTVELRLLRVMCRKHHERMHELIEELKLSPKFAGHPESETRDMGIYAKASEIIEKEIVDSGGKRITYKGAKVANEHHLRRLCLRGGWVGDSSHLMLQALFRQALKTEEHFENYSELRPVMVKLTEAVLEMDKLMRKKGLDGLPEMKGYSANPD